MASSSAIINHDRQDGDTREESRSNERRPSDIGQTRLEKRKSRKNLRGNMRPQNHSNSKCNRPLNGLPHPWPLSRPILFPHNTRLSSAFNSAREYHRIPTSQAKNPAEAFDRKSIRRVSAPIQRHPDRHRTPNEQENVAHDQRAPRIPLVRENRKETP
jgi:hypothetical protein